MTRAAGTAGIYVSPEPAGATLLVVTVEAIARRIVSGEFPVGSIIPNEAEIVEELGVSRTVVREAVRTLVAKGMLRTRRRLGTEVTPIASWSQFDRNVIDWRIRYDPDDKVLDDLVDIVMAVEIIAGIRCAEDLDFDASPLADAVSALEQADPTDRNTLAEAEQDFHRALVDTMGNSFCSHVHAVTESALSTFLSPMFISASSHAEALGQYQALADAVRSHAPAKARAAVEELGALRRISMRRAMRAMRT
ncbi:FadR/GntR family transcriptional regulator [Acuticoccus yangtzensis]|uniref:FadR/GntR family transcriptional regulator n=1 Tax=Acuticoccus yangtzensis TaxID=1443441 RepID=UPI0009496FA4|nr:GntR family transcriptional regulator [Acuticoccus yangtzensis]ORE94695.1 GntR family transcriptional regulator [Stappia sp. 22II-S9-Z10]